MEAEKSIRLEQSKEKATFSLSNEVKDNLEDSWLKLRRMLRRQRITKSSIVEEAIKIALEDLKNNNESSKIYKRLDRG